LLSLGEIIEVLGYLDLFHVLKPHVVVELNLIPSRRVQAILFPAHDHKVLHQGLNLEL
jgi:hypothetical protein